MKLIYLGEPEILHLPQGTFTIDKVPPKSTYMDRNRNDIIISDTFESPSDEAMEELYASAEAGFKKIIERND